MKHFVSYGSVVLFNGCGNAVVIKQAVLIDDTTVEIQYINWNTYNPQIFNPEITTNSTLPRKDFHGGAISQRFKLNEVSIIPFKDAFSVGWVRYNEFIHLHDTGVIVNNYSVHPEDNYARAIDIATKINGTVLIPVCTQKDQRYYLPVVGGDYLHDVIIRNEVYRNFLPSYNPNSDNYKSETE